MVQLDSTAIHKYAHHDNACRVGHGINFLSLREPLPQLTATTNLHTRTSMLVEVSALLQSLKQETIATTALLCHLKRHCNAQDPSSSWLLVVPGSRYA